MLARDRAHQPEGRQYTSWDRARLSVVVPVGVIVAVAIVCIVVAVLSSAQRADDVAAEQERQVLSRALSRQSARVLHELASVTESDDATRNIRDHFDPAWVDQHVGQRLQGFFDHDYVFVVDGNEHLLYSAVGRQPADPALYENARAYLGSLIAYVHGRDVLLPGAVKADGDGAAAGAHGRTALIQSFMGRPALVAALAVGADPKDAAIDAWAPVAISIKFIDRGALTILATTLHLERLRIVDDDEMSSSDATFAILDGNQHAVARFAWTPRKPGAEIVNSVVPFVAVALAGFALLAAFVLGYMRRTAAAIAAGEGRLRHLAMHDPLCGLPNRIYFGERLEATIEDVKAGGSNAAVFYIDLDHFKEVNDTMGHPAGDELIRNVTLRLSRALRENDLVARLGGDEFAVISRVGTDQNLVMDIAQRIISTLCAPYSINKQSIVIGASIGIAIIDKNCGVAADIMRYADMALYRAKNEGRNRACIYDTLMDADLSSRKLLESDLRRAIENNELRLLYQPIVNNSGETVLGVEALCRWTHPQRGEVPPSEFIPVAEHSGLIIELGEWVLRRACTDGKAWPKLTVAVNVSPLQFRRLDFVPMVERILAETGFDPARLELELTESTLIGNIETAEAAMRRLKALGVRLALDDFGTGYSSLLYLRRFPFDKLKIDRSFVLSIEKGSDAAAIVHAIVSLGRGLGMKVTAEGVETADQQLFLRAAGVHFMQGYRFGKAVDPSDITARLETPPSKESLSTRAALAG
ncbi:MAG: bifunctional diguanylate cyclase/phosphodiesterase [Pseudolabrys sp.]|nr:bifunctional diguanylate cyclase/phosphodiesterase [Pseudolabrys sp.]